MRKKVSECPACHGPFFADDIVVEVWIRDPATGKMLKSMAHLNCPKVEQ